MNLIRRPIYRVWQVVDLIRARRSPPDLGPAAEVLPGPLYRLFLDMPPEDQRHGLRMLAAVGGDPSDDAPLRQAALIHDVGKARSRIGVVHRVLRVLLAKPIPPLWRWLSGSQVGWREPFWTLANHPERGAVWIEAAGGSSELVALVRYHEADAPPDWVGTPLGRWHARLAAADADN